MKKMRIIVSGIMIVLVVCAGVSWADGTDTNLGNGSGTGGANSFNTSIGNSANGYGGGTYNTSIGAAAGDFIGYDMATAGSYNTYVGSSAGGFAGFESVANGNTVVGYSAGFYGGTNNTYIGTDAGFNNVGTGNVFLGYNAGDSLETANNQLIIHSCYPGGPSCNNPLIQGDFSTMTPQVNGTLILGTVVAEVSDERYKRNIQPLQQSLDKVTHLTGVSFEWKTDEYSGRGFKEGRQIGLIAQDVEKVFPELVLTDSKGYKAIEYDKLASVLIEAVKEQQKEIKAMQDKEIQYETTLKDKNDRIERLEKALEKIEQRMVAMETPAKTVALK